ncbi:hypothetical protein MRX96_058602 [Rhipicephalus microplus]
MGPDHIFAGISEAGIPRGRLSDIRDKCWEKNRARWRQNGRRNTARLFLASYRTRRASGMRPTRKHNSGTISRSANRTSQGGAHFESFAARVGRGAGRHDARTQGASGLASCDYRRFCRRALSAQPSEAGSGSNSLFTFWVGIPAVSVRQ